MDVAATFIAAVGTVVAVWGLWRAEFKALRGDIGALRTEFQGDMTQLGTGLRSEMGDLRGEMGRLRTELRSDMTQLAGDLRGEMGELKSGLRGELAELRTEMRADLRALGDKMDLVFTELLHHVQQGHPHGPPNQAA